MMIAVAEISARVFRIHPKRAGLFSLITVFVNTAYIGFPVYSVILGKTGVFYCSLHNMFFSLFSLPTVFAVSIDNLNEKIAGIF